MNFGARIRSLASDTAIYGLAKVAARFLTFFLNPFYTHALEVGEYGQVQTLYSYIALVLVMYPLGLDAAMLRFGSADEKRDEKRVFSTAAWFLLAVGVVASLLVAVLAGAISRWTALDGARDLIIAGAAVMLLDSMTTLPFAWLRLRRKARAYAAIQITAIVVNVALNLLFLLYFHYGAMGVLQANIASSAFTIVLLLPIFEKLLRPMFDRSLLREMLRFGLPLVPAGLAAMIVNAADRPLLTRLVGPEQAGLYGANYRLGMLMMLLVTMFQFAWQPFFLERGRDEDARPLFARILTYYLAGAMVIFLSVTLLVDKIVRLPLPGGRTLFAPQYFEGTVVVPWVLLGYVALGVYNNFSAGPTIAKRTMLFPWITGLAAAVNVIGNLTLIPIYGYLAAGWTTCAAYVVMAAGMWGAAAKIYPVAYEWGRLARVLGLGLGLWLLFVLLGGEQTGISLRLALLAAYPALLLGTGFLEPSERQALALRLGLSRRPD